MGTFMVRLLQCLTRTRVYLNLYTCDSLPQTIRISTIPLRPTFYSTAAYTHLLSAYLDYLDRITFNFIYFPVFCVCVCVAGLGSCLCYATDCVCLSAK